MHSMIGKRDISPARGMRRRHPVDRALAETNLQDAKRLVDEAEERVRCQSELVGTVGEHDYPLHVTLAVLAYLEQDLERCKQGLRMLRGE